MAVSERGAGLEKAPRAGDLARGPKLLFALAVIAALSLLCAPLFVERIDRAAPKPVAGTVDYSAYGSLKGPTPISGQWKLTWLSGAPGPAAGSTQLVDLPGRWSETASTTSPPLPTWAPPVAMGIPALRSSSATSPYSPTWVVM